MLVLERALKGILLFFALAFLSACGKTEVKDQSSASKQTEDLKKALDIITKIDPEYDKVEEIITQYGASAKLLKSKVEKGQATVEEKYVFVVADTLLLLHQLIDFLNSLIPVVIQGNLSQDSLRQVIDSIPTGSPHIQSNIERVFTKQGDPVSDLPYGCSGIGGLAQSFCSILDTALLRRVEYSIRYLREIQSEVAGKDFRMNIEKLPIKIQLSVLSYHLDFGGEHDLGTVYFFESLLDIIDAFFRFILSVNIDFINGISEVPKYAGSVSITEDPLLHGGRILSFLLLKNPIALNVSSKLEVERTFSQLNHSIDKTIKFIEYVKQNNVDTENDLIYFSSSEGGYYILRYKYNGQNREAKILRDSSVQNLRAIFEKLRRNINGDSSAMLSTGDLVFLASAAVVTVVKSGIFDVFVNFAITLAGQQQGEQIRQLLGSDLFQPETLSGILSGILGDIFYFDFGTFSSNLTGGNTSYREFLPAWTTFYPLDSFKNNIVLEWDCGARLYSDDITGYKRELFGLSCTSPSEGDISPFPASLTFSITSEQVKGWGNPISAQIPQDGIFFKFPYILFQDPTFGGLVKIRGRGIVEKAGDRNIEPFLNSCGVLVNNDRTDYRENRRAGLCAINSSIQFIIDGILGLVSG